MSVGEQPYQGDEALAGLLKKSGAERGFAPDSGDFGGGYRGPGGRASR